MNARPTSSALIERANVDDAAGIAEVHVRSWRWAYRNILPADHLASLDVDARAAMWSRVVSEPNRTVLARAHDRVVGFCACGPSSSIERTHVGELYAIYVDEARVGLGDGPALLHGAIERLRPLFGRVELWVLADNTRARRFYEKNAFVLDGTEKTVEIGGLSVREVRYVLDVPDVRSLV